MVVFHQSEATIHQSAATIHGCFPSVCSHNPLVCSHNPWLFSISKHKQTFVMMCCTCNLMMCVLFVCLVSHVCWLFPLLSTCSFVPTCKEADPREATPPQSDCRQHLRSCWRLVMEPLLIPSFQPSNWQLVRVLTIIDPSWNNWVSGCGSFRREQEQLGVNKSKFLKRQKCQTCWADPVQAFVTWKQMSLNWPLCCLRQSVEKKQKDIKPRTTSKCLIVEAWCLHLEDFKQSKIREIIITIDYLWRPIS